MAKIKDLYQPSRRTQGDTFEHYSGPMGGDMSQSIRDGECRKLKGENPAPTDRDMPRYWPPSEPKLTGKRGKRER